MISATRVSRLAVLLLTGACAVSGAAQVADLSSAESELREAVRRRPGDVAQLARLGGVLALEQKFVEAVDCFERALNLKPGDPILLTNLAASQWGAGRPDAAVIALNKVLQQDPGNQEAVFLLGMISESTRQYDRAAALLGSVQSLVRQRPDGAVALANSYYHTSQNESARQLLEKLAHPNVSGAIVFRGAQVALEAKDYTTAAKLVAAQLAAINPSSVVDLGKWYAMQGLVQSQSLHYSEAVKSYSQAAELSPKNPEIMLGLGTAQAAAGMISEALNTFNKGVERFPEFAPIHLQYGILMLELAERGDSRGAARAVSLLERAIALDQSLAEPHYRLGNLALANGSPRDAVGQLEAAAKLDVNSAKIHFALARAYIRLGRERDASKEQELFLMLKARQETEYLKPGMGIP